EERINSNYSLAPIANRLSELLNGLPVEFLTWRVDQYINEIIQATEKRQIVLLENIRFYPEEEKNDQEFSEKLAQLANIYVDDAFGSIHREHSSIVGVTKFLPSYAGLLLQKELNTLGKIINSPSRPITVIIGGAKISTKIKFIQKFLSWADNVLLGGALANTLLYAQGMSVGKSVYEKDIDSEKMKTVEVTNPKLHLPIDAIASEDKTGQKDIKIVPVGRIENNQLILDIGRDTQELFKSIINASATVIWNGPMGYYESPIFAQGTGFVARAIAESEVFSVIGGGETIDFINKIGLLRSFSYVSTGGGAMLRFLTGEKLVGVEALKQ
ncbi:MAG TPA: phosphoglycerate kinase, partial [Candidatus Portnoybacteria bacterium]|nr:phosphoglycerate kinase [Candidatus Portnoybacteria bacterium]